MRSSCHGARGRSSSARWRRRSARSPRRRCSATRTSTSSRPIRSTSGSHRRSSSRIATAACTRAASPTTRGTCSCSSRLLRQLAQAGALPVNVRFAFDGEEEVGGDSIVQWVDQDEGAADVAMILDGAMIRRGQPAFMVGVRGMVYLHLRVRTGATDMHSGMFGAAALNATHALMTALSSVVPRADGRLPRRAAGGRDSAYCRGARSLGAAPAGCRAARVAGCGAHRRRAPPTSSTCGRSRAHRST